MFRRLLTIDLKDFHAASSVSGIQFLCEILFEHNFSNLWTDADPAFSFGIAEIRKLNCEGRGKLMATTFSRVLHISHKFVCSGGRNAFSVFTKGAF
jgi:hypothetical protein